MVLFAVPTFIAMLRGINVSGHKIVKMDALRASFAALGFNDVKTYVQSGNVVFEAPNDSVASLLRKIEQKIVHDFGFSVPVFLTTSKAMAETIKRNSFLKQTDLDPTKLHVTFLSADPPPGAREQLQSLAAGSEQFHIIGRSIYLYCPDGYGRTRLSNTAIEKKLSVGATTRNWKTVRALAALSKGRE